jgi:hypothetical protein
MIRRLRIAASVFFAVLAVLLCVLWVRSYFIRDVISYADNSGNLVGLSLSYGSIDVMRSSPYGMSDLGWEYYSHSVNDNKDSWELEKMATRLVLPFWPIIVVAASGTCIGFGIGRRFSLRTLLIAVTLVAVLLGLGIWLTT